MILTYSEHSHLFFLLALHGKVDLAMHLIWALVQLNVYPEYREVYNPSFFATPFQI